MSGPIRRSIPKAHATYYARVLEIPTPRWSTYWAARLNLPPNPNVAATVQQRAWTSPIWYYASEIGVGS